MSFPAFSGYNKTLGVESEASEATLQLLLAEDSGLREKFIVVQVLEEHLSVLCVYDIHLYIVTIEMFM